MKNKSFKESGFSDFEGTKMKLFRGSSSHKQPSGVFCHLGSVRAAAIRLESIFTGLNIMVFDKDDGFFVFTQTGQRAGHISFNQLYEDFIAFMHKPRIAEHDINIKKPLRLVDCWHDDPIGSGAMDIFNAASGLTTKQEAEARKIFAPFTHVMYPDDIERHVSLSDVKRMEAEGRKNALFQQEFAKRRERSKIRGEDLDLVAPYEIVWTTMTLRLRTWALSNGFDSFVYSNDAEDGGDDCYVTLHDRQLSKPVQVLSFDEDKYRASISVGDFKKSFQASTATPKVHFRPEDDVKCTNPVHWLNLPPENFWAPS